MRSRVVALCLPLAACAADEGEGDPVDLELRVALENVSAPGGLATAAGDALDIIISPGVFAVHREAGALIPDGEAASAALEQLAEDGMSEPLAGAAQTATSISQSGQFGPQGPGGYESNPIAPGDISFFDLSATSADHLSMAAMFILSNDVLLATPPAGIDLPADLELDSPLDVTGSFALWDAGTERNEEPGAGANQPMNQGDPDTGPDEGGVVREIEGSDEAGFAYPSVAEFVRITITRRQP